MFRVAVLHTHMRSSLDLLPSKTASAHARMGAALASSPGSHRMTASSKERLRPLCLPGKEAAAIRRASAILESAMPKTLAP